MPTSQCRLPGATVKRSSLLWLPPRPLGFPVADVDDEYEDEDQWEDGAEDILEKGVWGPHLCKTALGCDLEGLESPSPTHAPHPPSPRFFLSLPERPALYPFPFRPMSWGRGLWVVGVVGRGLWDPRAPVNPFWGL